MRQVGPRTLEIAEAEQAQAKVPKPGAITIQNRSGILLRIWLRPTEWRGQPYTDIGNLPNNWNVRIKATRKIMWNVAANFGASPLSSYPNIYLDRDFLLKNSFTLKIKNIYR